jgi:hypothetical protein
VLTEMHTEDDDEHEREVRRSRWREPSGSVFLVVAFTALMLLLVAAWL